MIVNLHIDLITIKDYYAQHLLVFPLDTDLEISVHRSHHLE